MKLPEHRWCHGHIWHSKQSTFFFLRCFLQLGVWSTPDPVAVSPSHARPHHLSAHIHTRDTDTGHLTPIRILSQCVHLHRLAQGQTDHRIARRRATRLTRFGRIDAVDTHFDRLFLPLGHQQQRIAVHDPTDPPRPGRGLCQQRPGPHQPQHRKPAPGLHKTSLLARPWRRFALGRSGVNSASKVWARACMRSNAWSKPCASSAVKADKIWLLMACTCGISCS